MQDDTVVLTPSLDALIIERERDASHVIGEPCDYRLGRGQPLSKKRCSMCVRLSSLIDLSVSWIQKIDTGRLSGRSIEVAETVGARSERDAEAIWKLCRSCDNAQRVAHQSLLRRYYASFTCGTGHYTLRDVTTMTPPPVSTMIEQLIELFGDKSGFPASFVHGNPTVTSISFLGRLPVPLKHPTYHSRHLIQVDFGGADSLALTNAAAVIASRQKSASSVVVGDEPLGVVVVDKEHGCLKIRSGASFPSFLREYPTHWKSIALWLFTRGLLSLYPASEIKKYTGITPSSAKNLREAFDEIRGTDIPIDVAASLRSASSHSPV